MSRMFLFSASRLPILIKFSSTSTGALATAAWAARCLMRASTLFHVLRKQSRHSDRTSSECAATRASRASEVPYSLMRRGKRCTANALYQSFSKVEISSWLVKRFSAGRSRKYFDNIHTAHNRDERL